MTVGGASKRTATSAATQRSWRAGACPRRYIVIVLCCVLATVAFMHTTSERGSVAAAKMSRWLLDKQAAPSEGATIVVANISSSDDAALQHDISRACAALAATSQSESHPIIRMPWRLWTRLQLVANSHAARTACASSTWPLREPILPFLASAHMSTAAQARGGFMVTRLPLAWGDELDVQVDAATACAISDRIMTFAEHGLPDIVPLTVEGMQSALCLAPTGLDAVSTGPLAALSIPSPVYEPIRVTRRCAGSGRASGAWTLLMDGLLPRANTTADEGTVPGGAQLECGVTYERELAQNRMQSNYVGAHSATERSHVFEPVRFAAAMVRPVPPDFLNAVPTLALVHTDATLVADVAAAGDASAIRAALLEHPLGDDLPAMSTSFNVMISPAGVLTSLATSSRSSKDVQAGSDTPDCPALLNLIHEEEPAAHAFAKERGRAQFEASAIGGDDALAALRDRSPSVRFDPAWPASGGGALHEQPVSDSRVLIPPAAVAVGVHTACGADEDTMTTARVVGELIVIPAARRRHGDTFTSIVSAVGILELLMPYLHAHPQVLLHVSLDHASNKAADRVDDADDVRAWLELLGFGDRVVTGRVVASIVHVPDGVPRGPRIHPLHLLAARDAARTVMSGSSTGLDSPSASPTPTTPSVLLIQRHRERRVLTFGTLRTMLSVGRGASVSILSSGSGSRATGRDGDAAAAAALRTALLAWSGASAVVSPHGTEMTLAALALSPGAVLVEVIPAGHAALALQPLHASHYARLRHTIVIVPGYAMLDVELDAREVTALVCNEVGTALCPLPEPPRSTNGSMADNYAPARKREPHRECLPSPRPPPVAPLTSAEPIRALAPWKGVNATPREGCFVGLPRTRDTQYPWISTVLPLASATGGIALMLPAGQLSQRFIAEDPTQRGFLRALERRNVMPVALPGNLCAAQKNDIVAYNYSLACDNPDTEAAVSFVKAISAAIRSAARLPPSHYLPVYTIGLSSGATFPGTLAAHVRIDGVVGFMESPFHELLGRISPESRRIAPVPCDAAPMLSRPRELTPARPPSLWMVASAFEPVEGPAIHTFAVAWTAATQNKPVISTWAPEPVWADAVHARAPWLLSAAAGRTVVETLLAFGRITPATQQQWDDLRSYFPVCAESGAPTPLPEALPPSRGGWADARNSPLIAVRGIAYRWSPIAFFSASRSLRGAFAFSLQRKPDDPFFRVWSDVAALPESESLLWFARNESGGACWYSPHGGYVDWNGPAAEACRSAHHVWDIFYEFARRIVQEVRGFHEYHMPPAEDMVAWLAQRGADASAAHK